MTMRHMTVLVALALLAACARTPEPVAPAVVQADATPSPSLQQRVERVRSEAGDGQGLDVLPVRDAQVEDLREAASEAEAVGDLARAESLLAQALELRPDSPELLQQAAEVALLAGDVNSAIEWATRAWQLGPQVGSLCRRSWGTMREAYDEARHDEGVQIAARKIEDCTVVGPVRM